MGIDTDKVYLTRENARLRARIAELEAEKAGAVLLAAGWKRAAKQYRDEHKDLGESFEDILNCTWGLLYPDEPTSWEYPGQVFNHIRVELERYAKDKAAWHSALTTARSQVDVALGQAEAAARIRPMLAKLADDKNWYQATWFEDREPYVGFVFTGENEQGQTVDANEYAKDILAAFDAAAGAPQG